jgi:hypothetical protein
MSETKPEYPQKRVWPQEPEYHDAVSRPRQIITYPYPPFLLMEDGTYFEMPDIMTLVKMVYDLRRRVETLEKEVK